MTLYLSMQVPGDNDQCTDGERQRHVGASSGLPRRGVGDFWGNWGAFRIICLCFKDAGVSSVWSHLFILWKRNGEWSGKQGGHHSISRPCRAHHMDESRLLRGVLMETMSSGGGWVCVRAGKRCTDNQTPKNKVGQKCGVERKQSKLRTLVLTKLWNTLQTRPRAKHLQCGRWDWGVWEGVSSPCPNLVNKPSCPLKP